MGRLRYFLAAFFWLEILIPAVGQSTEYTVHPSVFDERYLRKTLLQTINQFRRQHHTDTLAYDSILGVAAQDQASFLLRTSTGGSLRNGDLKKRTPEKRIQFFGGNFLKSREFQVRTYVHEPVVPFPEIPEYYYINATYEQLARNLMASWTSEKDFRSPAFQLAGTGVALNPVTFEIVVVQLLGGGGGNAARYSAVPPHDSLHVVIPALQRPYAFRFQEPKDDRNLTKTVRWLKTVTSEQSGYISSPYRLARKTFRWWHRKTGVVPESNEVAAGTEREYHTMPARPDQTNLYKQKALSFIRAGTLMRQSRKLWWSQNKIEHVKIFGVIPTPLRRRPPVFLFFTGSSGTYNQLVVMRRKKLTGILPRLPLPAALFDPAPVRIPFQSLSGDFLGREKKILLRDTVTQRFFYARNEVQPDPEDITDIVSRIPADRLVREIRLEAHASVEGTQAANQVLYQQRGEVVKKFLQDNNLVTRDVQLTVQASENWALFDEQIKGSPYEGLAGKDRTNVRTFINLHKNDTLIRTWLDEQRFSNVFLLLNRPVTVAVTEDSLAREFNAIARKPPAVFNDQTFLMIYRIQWSYYDRIVKSGNPERWTQLQIPENRLWASMRFNELMFRWNNKFLSEVEFFTALQRLGSERTVMVPLYARLLFNNSAWLLNHYFCDRDLQQTVRLATFRRLDHRDKLLYFKTPNRRTKYAVDTRPEEIILLDYLPQTIRDLNRFGENAGVKEKLREFYLIRSIAAYDHWNAVKYRSVIRNFITDLWNNHVTRAKLSDEDRIRWTLFFNYFNDYSKSSWLLSPIVARPMPNSEALSLWISILSHQQPHATVRDAILEARKTMTDSEWIELVSSGNYVPASCLEDYRIRMEYQKILRLRSVRDSRH